MAAEHWIELTVNGTIYRREVEPRLLLIDLIRNELGLTGSHIGCDTTTCGACTIYLDGRSVKSCTMFAVQADGAELLTVEGLSSGEGAATRFSKPFMRSTAFSAATAHRAC